MPGTNEAATSRATSTGVGRFMLAVVIVASLLAPTATSAFSDVDEDAFYGESVAWLVDQGVVFGRSPDVFDPLAAVTRGEFATMVWRFAGSPPAVGDAPFTDVVPGSFYATAVAWMSDTEITTGRTPTTFDPEAPVSRAEIATFLWRYACEPERRLTWDFDDVEAGSFYDGAVGWLWDAGISTGKTTVLFGPLDTATRGEAATFLWRLAGSPDVGMSGINRTTSAPGCPRPAADCDGIVVNEMGLNLAIDCVNAIAKAGEVRLVLGADVYLTRSTRGIENETPGVVLTIVGMGHAIDGQGLMGVRPLRIQHGPDLVLTDLTLRGGNPVQMLPGDSFPSPGLGGGLDASGARVTLVRTTVTDNLAFRGGGILIGGGELKLFESTISNNHGDPFAGGESGGGIYASGTPVEIVSSTIVGNVAYFGGGIHSNGGLVITDSTISDNGAHTGGGIYLNGSGSVIRSTISGNASGNGGGGGIFFNGFTSSVLTVANSTISGNQSQSGGAGLTLDTKGAVNIVSSTVADNFTTFWGTASLLNNALAGEGVLTLSNSVVKDPPDFALANCNGIITSAGYNMDTDGSCALGGPGDLTSSLPGLGPLADNGGPTLTHLPGLGSPLIGAGSDSVCASSPVGGIDQRSEPRDDGSCDIGAVERS